MYPTIRHILDVLPTVVDNPHFSHKVKEGYQILDYIYQDASIFHTPLERECRGLKFDLAGNLIARPFHKFFNVGERTAATDLPWHLPYVIEEKIDGSMVHPILLNNEIVWCTRAGITDVSKEVPELPRRTLSLLYSLLSSGYTPIFEFTSPKNQVVLPHSTKTLYLLGMRNNTTGDYASTDMLPSEDWKTPALLHLDTWEEIHQHTTSLTDAEGFVLKFDNTSFYKLKTPWYLLRHRYSTMAFTPKSMLSLALHNESDDIVPYMPPDLQPKFEAYKIKVHLNISQWVDDLYHTLLEINENIKDLTFSSSAARQKEIAVHIQRFPLKAFRPILYANWLAPKRSDIREQVVQTLLSSMRRQETMYSLMQQMALPEWN